ncbi:MAG: YtxH domain-containing protein [Acidobacteriota bacterium]|nr:YtxH domain-containing protein [Acidobacteriota bacterium]
MGKQRNEERQQNNDFQNPNASGVAGWSSSGRSDKLTYLLVGGGIGALLALLFAPKSGSELRTDLADVARKGVDRTRDTATQFGEKSSGYLNSAKQRAGDIYSRTGGVLNAARSEFGRKSGSENERSFNELTSGPHDATASAATNRDEHDDFPIA